MHKRNTKDFTNKTFKERINEILKDKALVTDQQSKNKVIKLKQRIKIG